MKSIAQMFKAWMDAQNYDVADSIVAKWLNDHDPKGMSEVVKWGEGDATKFTFTDGSVALLEEDGVMVLQ
jgi:hypothetical protein